MIHQKPKVLITEHHIKPLVTQYENFPKPIIKVLSTDIYLAISRYSDSFMIIINQTGTMGSIYSGRYVGESLPQLEQEDQDFYDHSQKMRQNQEQQFITQKIYQIKCLFGSTDIQFYELLMRKILAVIFQENKINSSMKVLLNISLPVKCKLWEENQHRYYQEIIEKLKCAIKEVN